MFLRKAHVLVICLLSGMPPAMFGQGGGVSVAAGLRPAEVYMFIPGQGGDGRLDTTRSIRVREVSIMASRVDATQQGLPRKVEVIPEKLIGSLPSANLGEVMKRVVNLDIMQYPGDLAGIGMRGFAPGLSERNYTLLLINGMPSATVNVAAIKMDNVERVEVIKGPYSVLYGSDAMAGVVNIVTKHESSEPEVMVSAEAGGFGNLNLSAAVAGHAGDKVSFRLGYARMAQTKNYRIGGGNLLRLTAAEKKMLDERSAGDRMENSKYRMSQANAFACYRPHHRWRISAEAIFMYAPDVEIPVDYWGMSPMTKKDKSRLNLQASVQRDSHGNNFRFSPYLSSDNGAAYSDNTDDGFKNLETHVREYGFQLQDMQLFGSFNILAGVDGRVYDYTSRRWETAGVSTFPYQPDNATSNIGLFTRAAWSASVVEISAGLRYDRIRYKIEANEELNASRAEESYATVNPSAEAQLRLPGGIKAHASFGSAFKVPNPYQVAGSYTIDYGWGPSTYTGNPELKPEKSKTAEAGLTCQSPQRAMTAGVTCFHTDHTDKIVSVYDPSTGETSYKNAGKATMQGIELMSSFDMRSMVDNNLNLELYANWTWMLRNNFEEETATGVQTRETLFVRKSSGNFGLTCEPLRSLSLRLNGRYAGWRLENDFFIDYGSSQSLRGLTDDDYYAGDGYTPADKILKYPGVMLFDCSVKYSPGKSLTLGVTVANLLDENYSEKDGYNMPGRQVTARVAYNL